MGTCLSILCRIFCICYWNIFSCWARHSVLTYQSLIFSACLVSLSNDTEWHSLVSLKRPDLRAGYIPPWCFRWHLPFRKSYLIPVWLGVETSTQGSPWPDFTTQQEDQSHPCPKFMNFWVRQEAFLWKFHQDALAPGPFPRSQACEALPRRPQLLGGRPHSRKVSSFQWLTTNSKREYKYRTLPPAEAPEARIVWQLRKRAQNPLSFLFYFFYRKTLCFCHSMHELSRLQ